MGAAVLLFHICMLPVPYPQGAVLSLTEPPVGSPQTVCFVIFFIFFIFELLDVNVNVF